MERSKRTSPPWIAGYDPVGVDAYLRNQADRGWAVASISVLGELSAPYRTMVLIAACLGLRASEIVGLQLRF